MPNTAVRAAAEGSPVETTISRRTALRGLLALPAAAAPIAIMATPSEAAEYPVDKVNRLAEELSLAMDEWCADIGGIWRAHILPASYTT